jgi:hypothetical protein
MNQPGAEADAGLLFEWAPPTGEKFLISTFLVVSLLLHALAFYLFRIIYPPAIALLPPPARVNLISANSEEGRTLLRWIEAEDPALASATLRPSESKSRALPKLTHIPSYTVQEPKLKEPPPFNVLGAAPDAFPPRPARVFGNKNEPAWPKIPTRVSFSDELSGFGAINLSAAQFAGSGGEPPENVRFRVGVDQRGGEIRYCFRLNSSGDSGLDEQARLWLVRGRFPDHPAPGSADPAEQNLVWGVATVEWGNDIQPARAATPATP